MYRNLKAEMVRQDIKPEQIAEALNIKLATARLKINGNVPFRLDECKRVAALFKDKNGLNYLFQE